MKERYGITELHKQASRVKFGVAEDEYRESFKGFGMLGQQGTGKLRVSVKEQKISKQIS